MRISPIQNYKYNNIQFGGTAPINTSFMPDLGQEANNKPNKEYKLPEWVRKSTLFGLIGLAVINDPVTKDFFKSETEKMREQYEKEYFQDVSNLKTTSAAHHLNMLADVDKPTIRPCGNGQYNIRLNLDNNQKINFRVNLSYENENVLQGIFKVEHQPTLMYKATFNDKNPEEFTIEVRNYKQDKYIFGRKANGELYRLEGNKKIILNKENAKKYQQELKTNEELNNWEFFTSKNDMWRKLNLILLFLLTLNEWGHDLEKRDKERNKK